jgi:hypothetical protein
LIGGVPDTGAELGWEKVMATSAAAARAYQSVRRRSTVPMRQRTSGTALLRMWLGFVLRVVVVGSVAFGAGFLGVVAARSLGWVVAGHGDGALAPAVWMLA